ncbi:alkaline phosphatase, partial [Bacteroidota bacterium]
IETTNLIFNNEISIDKKYGFLLAPEYMPRMLDGRGDFLPDATRMALEYLSLNKKGFFLMVEGSQIDWGGHEKDADYLIAELIDFDHAIGVALDFAEKHGNTLVIVTADHETGGFALASKGGDGMESDYDIIAPAFATDSHTATLVPVFALGPGSETFIGVYEIMEIYHKMLNLTK